MTFKTVYLIRHAAPQKGTGIPYDVPPGPPLSEAGQREARQMAEFLAGRGIQRIVHSPLDRTAMTAEALGSRLGLPVVEAADLAEHRRDEKADEVRIRVQAFFTREMGRPETVLAVVSHGSPLKLLIEWLTEGRERFIGMNFPDNNVTPTAGVWQARGALGAPWEVLFVFQPNIMPAPEPIPAWAGGGRVA